MSKNHPLADFKKIDAEHKTNRVIVITVVAACLILTAWDRYNNYKTIEDIRSKIYVLQNGNALVYAMKNNADENRPAEVKHHIKMLFENLFNLPADIAQIKKQNEAAFLLGDNSIKQFTNTLNEQKYYERLVGQSVTQKLELDPDGIQIDFSVYPYKAVVIAKLQLIRSSMIAVHEIKCTLNLINVPRSDANSHGLLVEKFEMISNQKIEEYARTN